MNLIANAIDAIEARLQSNQNDTASAPAPCIRIRTEVLTDQTAIVIQIQDNGIGMPDTVKQRIFDQQFTTKPVGKGTGLGLSIARQLVKEIHGGQLRCTSVLGIGTEFVIQIPR